MKYKRIIIWGTLCFLSFCQTEAFAEMVSVKGEDINMRSGPATTSTVLYKLGSGMPLDVLKHAGDWLHVQDFEGDKGWVHQSTVSSTPAVIVKANKNSQAQINVRSGPGTSYKIVATACYGVVFKKIGEEGQWIEVEHGTEAKGWVERSLLWGF